MDVDRKKIVIVDDNAANLSVGRNLLKPFFEVYPAPSAAKLFALVEKFIPDLILLDVNMPEMNGYEAIKVLKADPRLASIPVIFLTAKNDEESELEGFDLGAADYVTKPFSGPLLLRRITNQLLLEQQKHDLLESQAALQDYTDNLEIKVREKTAAKTVFLANMSHELRTPMNSIVGFSELALDDEISLKTRGYLTNILENSEWLLHIINDILDITNIESGKIVLNNISFDLYDIISSCQKMFIPKATEHGLMLNFSTDPEANKTLVGDPVRLRQVFINLLSNAIKFTSSGMVEFTVEVKEETARSITIHFEVRDSGIGMTSEQIGIIFEPFTQVDAGSTRRYGGAGLGLTISKKIVEMMGGYIAVESTPGAGSTFAFTLVFETPKANEKEPAANAAYDGTKRPIFNGEVLVCEDNAMNQQVACEYLAKAGLRTVVAGNGQIGLDMVKNRIQNQERPFDLILMDIHMPVMSGVEAAERIFALGAGIPIAAMTANIMPEDVELYKTAGMKDCVGKPFTSQELWCCLLNHLEPVAWQTENAAGCEREEEELRQRLIGRFVENYGGAIDVLNQALNRNDIPAAHRLVHTIKSNAGQLGKPLLRKAAEDAESSLKNGAGALTPQQVQTLKIHLEEALDEYTVMINEIPRTAAGTSPLEGPAACAMLEELEALLADSDPECLLLVSALGRIPGSGDMIRMIENFDFKSAMAALASLKKVVG